jgi:capsular polysaccharide biosynthesis protein
MGSSRVIRNLSFLVTSLQALGADVTVVAFECMCLAEQIAAVANSSTLIGAHGAGLSHGNALPDDAAIVELRSSPSNATSAFTSMGFRPRHAIGGAPRAVTILAANCSDHGGPWASNSKAAVIADIDKVVDAVKRLDPIGLRGEKASLKSIHFFLPKSTGPGGR